MSDSAALVTAIAHAPESDARARLLHEGAGSLLAGALAVDAVARAAATADEGDEAEAAAALLSRALDEARMAAENDAPEGPALMDAVAATLCDRDAAAPFPPVVRMRLAGIYARAGLAPPPFALLSPGTADAFGEDPAASPDAPDIEAALDDLIREAGDEPLQVHAALGELFAGLPADLGATLVATTIARPGAIGARLGLYWLLDREPPVRLAAATALLQRAEAGALAPEAAQLLPAIRNWLPEDCARDVLDATIRRVMREASPRPGRPETVISRAGASLPDGAGAQSLFAAVQSGKRRGVAMVMLKQGHGVKDAFVIPCKSAAEQKRMVAGVLAEIETIDVAPLAVAEALSVALGEGIALDAPPAPGLVDMIALFGAEALLPAPSQAGAILAAMGANETLAGLSAARRAALIDASGMWTARVAQTRSWFEDAGPLRAAIGRARTDRGRANAVWKHLETRRAWWARQFAVSAATLAANVEPEPELWLSFAAVAQALLDGRALKKTPIMAVIVERSLSAFDAREGDAAAAVAVAAPPASGRHLHDGIDHTAADGRLGEAYLTGYLVALAVSPLPPAPQAWVGPLLAGAGFTGEGALDRFLEGLMARANRVDDDAADPQVVGASIRALDEAGLRDWASGFAALVSAAPQDWPASALAADDKRILDEIRAVSKGGDAAALRAVLPAWVARRHALRR